MHGLELKSIFPSPFPHDETIQQRGENTMTHRVSRKPACHKAMEIDTEKIYHNPRIMESVEEHQEVPKGEAGVMPVR
jgi:hypothetical protein